MHSPESLFDLSSTPDLWLYFERQAAKKPNWLELRPSMQKIVVGTMAQIQPLKSAQLLERHRTHTELVQSGLPLGPYAAYGARRRDEVAQRLARGATDETPVLRLLVNQAEVRVARGVFSSPPDIDKAIKDTYHPELLQAIRVVNELHHENA